MPGREKGIAAKKYIKTSFYLGLDVPLEEL